MSMGRTWISLTVAAALGAVTMACDSEENGPGASTASGSDTDSSDSDQSGSGMMTTGVGTTGPTTETSDTADTGDTSDTDDETTGVGFIQSPDGGPINECDLWSQDCPVGEKCMPWANDGGGAWNASKCTPVDSSPGEPGDSCTVEGSGVSGVDSCALSSMCWNVDPETNLGTCVGFCEGSQASPVCSDPDNGCSISNDGVLILCLAYCDPLLQDCADGEACYAEENGFFCSPDASGPDVGTYGDPCEFLNACDPGLWCAGAEVVPGCTGSAGCCSEYCDFTDPDASCSGQGQMCVAFYEEGAAPPGYESVGVCVIPQ